MDSRSYGSEHYLPAACSQTALSPDRPFLAPALSPSVSRSLRIGQGADSASSSYSEVASGAAETFWALVNPRNSTSVQVYLEPPISIQFLDDGALAAPESLEALLPHEQSTSIFVKVGVVLLPIAVVMGLLYVLLIYLLKDAELLQAHWGSEERLGGVGRKRRRHSSLKKSQAGIEAVPDRHGALRHQHDVEVIASRGDILITWAALDTHLRVSRLVSGAFQHAYDVALDGFESVPALARIVLDSSATHCAVLSTDGKFFVWELAKEAAVPVRFAGEGEANSPITCVVPAYGTDFALPRVSTDSQGVPPMSPSSHPAGEPVFYTLHKDGSVHQWAITAAGSTCRRVCAPSSRRYLVPTRSGAPLSVVLDKGDKMQVEPLDGGKSGPQLDIVLDVAHFTALASVRLSVANNQDSLFAIGRSSGLLEIHGAGESPAVARIEAFEEPVRKISLRPQRADTTCPDCGTLLGHGCLLIASTRRTLKVFQVFAPPEDAGDECICRPDVLGRSAPSSPTISRVSSMSTPSRRFSPRKKVATPTRPAQPSFVTDASLRPPAPPTRTPSPHGSSSPERERERTTNGLTSPAAPPPRSKPVSPHASPPPTSARLPDTTPSRPAVFSLFSSEQSTLDDANGLAPRSVSPRQLHHIEVASIAIDERGSWTALADRVIGLRRSTDSLYDTERDLGGARGWEVWSLALGLPGGPLDAGFLETTSSLKDALGTLDGDVQESTSIGGKVAVKSKSDSLHPGGHAQTALRRRRPSMLPPDDDAKPAPPAPSLLPFSRARPLVHALDGSAVAVGLGNRVVVLRPTSTGQGPAIRDQGNGFLGI